MWNRFIWLGRRPSGRALVNMATNIRVIQFHAAVPEKVTFNQSRNSPYFTEPEGPLPCSGISDNSGALFNIS
jgi:hypothetical protein